MAAMLHPNYPTLRAGTVQSLLEIRRQFLEDAAFLNPEKCPYDPETIKDLVELFRATRIPQPTQSPEGEKGEKVGAGRGRGRPRSDDPLKMLSTERRSVAAEELEKVQAELAELRKMAKESADPELKLAVAKTSVQLIEKLTVLEERHSSLRKVAQFQTTILSILDDLMPDSVREDFMERIAKLAENDN